MIKQDKAGKWWLHYSDGRKEGPFPSQKHVMAREKQVNYFKHRNKPMREAMLSEGWWADLKALRKNAPNIVPNAIQDIRSGIRSEIEQSADAAVKKYSPEVKKGAKRFVAGLGAASFVGAGAGSYVGNKAGHKRKIVKESVVTLLPFSIGLNSIFSKARGQETNLLMQEGFISRLFKAKKTIPQSVLSAEQLGMAMRKNPNAMEQAFRIYGSNSRTIKNAIPTAFGRVTKVKK